MDVHLVSYNATPLHILREAGRQHVTVHQLGCYREYLHRLHLRGAILAEYPTLHKFLSLHHLPLKNVSQILFVDCDTFFFDDPEMLFPRYSERDWYAREEPTTKWSYLGYDPDYLDEDLLATVAQREGISWTPPFNSGVCILNHQIWKRLDRFRVTFLDVAWRLLAGREAEADAYDRMRALPYPSSNPWIVEQIALWLTLGRIPDFSFGYLAREHAAQNGEFADRDRACVLTHYFSKLEDEFFAAVPEIN